MATFLLDELILTSKNIYKSQTHMKTIQYIKLDIYI